MRFDGNGGRKTYGMEGVLARDDEGGMSKWGRVEGGGGKTRVYGLSQQDMHVGKKANRLL